MTIKFDITSAEFDTIRKIVDRADAEFPPGYKVDRKTMLMDLSAAHNDIPLDFERLLAFPPFDFAHDVCGIQRHINRETGKLEDCFVPRCAK